MEVISSNVAYAQFVDQLEELKRQLCKGGITQEDFEQKMAEVREEYDRKKKKEFEKWEKSVKWKSIAPC